MRHHLEVIDRSGQWWTGTEADDVREYLRSLTEDGYPAVRFAQAMCSCANAAFHLEIDDVEGCARRTCAQCGRNHFICDSGASADDSSLVAVRCSCGGDQFEVVAGFSRRDEKTVRWITVGVRCVRCGVLGSPVDWEIDYAPTSHLYDLV